MRKIPITKINHFSRNGVNNVENTDTQPNVDKNNKITKKPQKYKEPTKTFYQYMKKDQNLPNKKVHSNNSSGKPLPNISNYSTNQSP